MSASSPRAEVRDGPVAHISDDSVTEPSHNRVRPVNLTCPGGVDGPVGTRSYDALTV
jgi:hypothetical protein